MSDKDKITAEDLNVEEKAGTDDITVTTEDVACSPEFKDGCTDGDPE